MARALFVSPALYPAALRQSPALRTLVRAWAQYREDRAITLGASLVGAECAAERNAFFALLAHALPDRSGPLAQALTQVRRTRHPPARRRGRAERRDHRRQLARSRRGTRAALAAGSLPHAPLERLLALVERFRYSAGNSGDALAATAQTPCWAINLAAVARTEVFALGAIPLPCPGIVQRRSNLRGAPHHRTGEPACGVPRCHL